MAFLDTPGLFESKINREGLHFRSKRLDALVAAVSEYVGAPSLPRLETVERRLEEWKAADPKEFANRGRPVESQLRYEIGTRGAPHWGLGVPHIVDAGSHPVYEPMRWNDNAGVQFSTNCYAYACNDSYFHTAFGKPQPGQLAGRAVRQAEESVVRWAVMQDDMTRNARQMQRLIPLVRLKGDAIPSAVNIPGYYLIALVTAPGVDYHWLRQDRNGIWSHKPGHDLATNRDSRGQLITDPREATIMIGPYQYEFNTFYYAPTGGVRTGELGRRPRRGAIV